MNLYTPHVVRRDEDGSPGPEWVGNPSTRRGDPAGASPVPVGRDAPGSRLPTREDLSGRSPVEQSRTEPGTDSEAATEAETDPDAEGRDRGPRPWRRLLG